MFTQINRNQFKYVVQTLSISFTRSKKKHTFLNFGLKHLKIQLNFWILLRFEEINDKNGQHLSEVIPNEFRLWFISSFPFWIRRKTTKSFGKSNRLGNICEIQYQHLCSSLSGICEHIYCSLISDSFRANGTHFISSLVRLSVSPLAEIFGVHI